MHWWTSIGAFMAVGFGAAMSFFYPHAVSAPQPLATTTQTMEQMVITQEQAIDIATKDGDGFLGTYVSATLQEGRWYVDAFSKSIKPPLLYIIDAVSGEILYKNLNYDRTKGVPSKEKLY